MIDLTQLNLDSTLGYLPSYEFQVSSTTPGRIVAEKFGQDPDLPGVIIIHDSQMLGMISRTKFREQMISHDRIELYSNCPIRVLLDFIRIPPLLLAENWKIDEATQTILNRPKDLVYEPIIVVLEDQSLRLLDVHTLLLAQSKILVKTNQIIHQQTVEAQHSREELEQHQEKLREYSQLLELKERQLLKSSNSVNSEQVAALKQAQEIAQLNQRFMRVGQLISLEFRRLFQTTLGGINSICNHSDRTLDIGKAIAKDLEIVNRASQMIGEIIQQVRHLAVQAAVVANQNCNQDSGLSQVSLEIGRLATQTFEVSHQMDQAASRFKLHLQELGEAAKSGTNVARLVGQKTERAEMALLELEEVLLDKNPNPLPVLQPKPKDRDAVTAQSLTKKVEESEPSILERENQIENPRSRHLIQKIEYTLKHNKNRLEQ